MRIFVVFQDDYEAPFLGFEKNTLPNYQQFTDFCKKEMNQFSRVPLSKTGNFVNHDSDGPFLGFEKRSLQNYQNATVFYNKLLICLSKFPSDDKLLLHSSVNLTRKQKFYFITNYFLDLLIICRTLYINIWEILNIGESGA